MAFAWVDYVISDLLSAKADSHSLNVYTMLVTQYFMAKIRKILLTEN